MSDDEQTRTSAPDDTDRPTTGRRRRAETADNGHDPRETTGSLPTLVLPTLVPPPRPPRRADTGPAFTLGTDDEPVPVVLVQDGSDPEAVSPDGPTAPAAPDDRPGSDDGPSWEAGPESARHAPGHAAPEPDPEQHVVQNAEDPIVTSQDPDLPTSGRHQVSDDPAPASFDDTLPAFVTDAAQDLDTPAAGVPIVMPTAPRTAAGSEVLADLWAAENADDQDDIPLLTHAAPADPQLRADDPVHRSLFTDPTGAHQTPVQQAPTQPAAAPQPPVQPTPSTTQQAPDQQSTSQGPIPQAPAPQAPAPRAPQPMQQEWHSAPQSWPAPPQSWPTDPTAGQAPRQVDPASYPSATPWPAVQTPTGPRPLWRPEGTGHPAASWTAPQHQESPVPPSLPAAMPQPEAPAARQTWPQPQPQLDEPSPFAGPRLTDFLAQQAPPPELPATWGLRGMLTRMGLRMSPTGVELAHRQALATIQRPLGGPKTIVVVNQKGGAGKTPATFLLAAVIGRVRGGFTLAWDNNENAGTLGWKGVGQERAATVVDLLSELERFTHPELGRVGDLDNFVRSQGDDRFDLLASNQTTDHGTGQIGSEDFLAIHDAMSRYYRVLVVDTGNNDLAPNWQAALDSADQIVVPIRLGLDYAGGASRTLDVLDDIGHGDLVRGAVAIVSQSTDADKPDVRAHVRDHFGPRVRSIVDVPFDPALVEGRIVYDALKPATRNAWIRAAAAVVSGL